MGGDLGALGGTVPPKKLKVGGRPMHPSPNISKISVIGCVSKYELTKKSETEVFRQEKGSYMLDIGFQTGKRQTKYGQ